jgi:hypothetical protein
VQRNCCLECHFGYEESLALPYLPQHLQIRLVAEHMALERAGFPDAAVKAHAAWEEEAFRIYCPLAIRRIIERDHEAHGHGALVSRTAARRSGSMFSPRWSMASAI